MRIIIIPHSFQSHYTVDFLNALAANGVIASAIISSELNTALLDARITTENFRGSTSPYRNFLDKLMNIIKYHTLLLFYILRHRNSIVHIIATFDFDKSIVAALIGIIETLLIRIFSKRLILTVHNLLPHNKIGRIYHLIYRCMYNVPDFLVVHTERIKKQLYSAYSINEHKIVIVEHGLNSTMQNLAGVNRGNVGHATHTTENTRLLFFGNISYYKGLDTLLRTFDKLGNKFYLTIAGCFREQKHRRIIVDMINNNKNKDRILLIDRFICDNEIPSLFSACDCIVLPYRQIEQSGVLFLALSLGVPIICSNIGSFAEYIDSGNGILVDLKNEDALQIAIEQLDRAKRQFDKFAIIKRAERLKWESTVKPLMEIYSVLD